MIVFLALWAYFSAMFSDPGFVPNQYEYDLSKMSVLIAALYRQTARYQHEKIDITQANGNFQQYTEMRLEEKYTFELPLLAGDGTSVEPSKFQVNNKLVRNSQGMIKDEEQMFESATTEIMKGSTEQQSQQEMQQKSRFQYPMS